MNEMFIFAATPGRSSSAIPHGEVDVQQYEVADITNTNDLRGYIQNFRTESITK
jgi:hypothetical protein